MIIAYTNNEDKKLHIVTGAPNASDEAVWATVPKDAIDAQEIQEENIPNDRSDRDNWTMEILKGK